MNQRAPSGFDFPKVVDSTMAAAFDACAQKFFDEFIVCLATKAVSPDLHPGGTFARGMEVARKHLYGEGNPVGGPTEDILIRALQLATREMMRFWNNYDPPHKSAKDLVNTICALYDYFRVYPPWSDPLQPYIMANGKPAIEFTFAIPLLVAHPQTGEPILYGGRCDMIGKYEDFLAVVDDKTGKSVSGEKWVLKWDMRGQFLGYVWAAQQYGYNLDTAIVRGIAIQKTKYEHRQAIVTFPRWQIDLWYKQLNVKVARMAAMFKAMDARPETHHAAWDSSFGDACSSYGCCSYIGLCTSETPQDWYSDFERRVWDPLAKDPTAEGVSRLEVMESVALAAAMKGVR